MYSAPGSGTDVHLFLPSEEAAIQLEDSVPVIGDKISANGRVLVVEDRADVMKVVCTQLQGLGFESLTAVAGKDAIRLFQKEMANIDVIVSDVSLPGDIDGIEVATRAVQAKPSLRVILMSGDPTVSNGNTMSERTDFLLLRKPFTRSDLARALID